MKYFIRERQEEDLQRTAGIKARDDLEEILSGQGISGIEVISSTEARRKASRPGKLIWHLRTLSVWKKALAGLKAGDTVYIQLPVSAHSVLLARYFGGLIRRGIKLCFFIHDLELLRVARRQDVSPARRWRINREEKDCLKIGGTIVAHNERMKQLIRDEFGVREDRILVLSLFDYLIPDFRKDDMKAFSRTGPLIIAGNLRRHKAAYVYDLPDEPAFHLYGIGYEGEDSENILYFGSFAPDDLPYAMSGSFGLVWDGESQDTCTGVYGEYLRINNPHKTSLYLACGIPVLIWEEAALAGFVRANRCGIAVASISEARDVIERMTDEEYRDLKQSAERVGQCLRDGYYTKRILGEV